MQHTSRCSLAALPCIHLTISQASKQLSELWWRACALRRDDSVSWSIWSQFDGLVHTSRTLIKSLLELLAMLERPTTSRSRSHGTKAMEADDAPTFSWSLSRCLPPCHRAHARHICMLKRLWVPSLLLKRQSMCPEVVRFIFAEHALALTMLHVSGLASRPHVDEQPRDEAASVVME